MNKPCPLLPLLALLISLSFFACTTEPDPWADFTKCSAKSCVKEALVVKDAFLKDPKGMLGAFSATYKKGEDHVIGWLYLLRDSVLFNDQYGTTEERFALQQAIISAAKPFENDPKLGEMAQSVTGELENLAIASELEDDIFEYVPITGSYAYELPNEAGSGELKVSVADSDHIRFSLMVVAGPPAYNQGTMENTATLVSPNVYEAKTTEYTGTCRLQFVFNGESVEIKTLEGDDASCGFGHNVRADQVYKVVSHDDPFLSAADARLAKNLQGKWVSTTDAKSKLTIENGEYTETYDQEEPGSFPYQFYAKCPADCNPVAPTPCIKVMGQDDVCYAVVKADGKTLELSMIGGRGNTLVFKKQ